MERIAFDLQKALAGAPVVHENGYDVRNLCQVGERLAYTLTGHEDAADYIYQCYPSGISASGRTVLFMAPPEPKRNVYYGVVGGDGFLRGSRYDKEFFQRTSPYAHLQLIKVTTEKRDGSWYFVSAEVVA